MYSIIWWWFKHRLHEQSSHIFSPYRPLLQDHFIEYSTLYSLIFKCYFLSYLSHYLNSHTCAGLFWNLLFCSKYLLVDSNMNAKLSYIPLTFWYIFLWTVKYPIPSSLLLPSNYYSFSKFSQLQIYSPKWTACATCQALKKVHPTGLTKQSVLSLQNNLGNTDIYTITL